VLATTCTDVIVGGGWSGVYFAYRRALSKSPASAAGMCLFEATSRIGGRTYSVPPSVLGKEFTLDVGAYRFSPDMHLPGDLILHDLKLPVACYEPSCPSAKDDFPPPFLFNYTAPLVRIVDPSTNLPAGYVTAMHVMLDKLKPLGLRIFLDAPVVDIKPGSTSSASTTSLVFANGTATASGTVMLNLPRNKLLALTSLRTTLPERTLKTLECVKFDAPKKEFPQPMDTATGLTKAYLYYSDAWWHTKLNLTSGQFPHNAFHPIETSVGIGIGVHWNDGPVLCTDSAGTSFNPQLRENAARVTVECHGYLQVYYAATNETFYFSSSGAPAEPLGIVGTSPPFDHAKLDKVHSALLEAIAPVLAKHSVAPAALSSPTQLVVGVWSRPGVIQHDTGYTAPTKVYWAPSISGSLGGACGVDGLTPAEYRSTVMRPFGKAAPIYVANNDWVEQDVAYFMGDWAEESLLQCERALYLLGEPKPSWLNATYYDAKIKALA